MTLVTKQKLGELHRYFETTLMRAKSGNVLRIESDGRAGDGHTHWRAVYIGKKLVGVLADSRGGAYVALAKRGVVRGQPHKEFPNLKAAAEHLVEVL